MGDKILRFFIQFAQQALLRIIWFVGFSFSLIPVFVFVKVYQEGPPAKTFGESAVMTLGILLCVGISAGLMLLLNWLTKRWGQ